MSNLQVIDKEILEHLLMMKGSGQDGYVLNFSDRTMSIFFKENFNIDIYDKKYDFDFPSRSKANRMRGIWMYENDRTVANTISNLLEYIEVQTSIGMEGVVYNEDLTEKTKSIIDKLKKTPQNKAKIVTPDKETNRFFNSYTTKNLYAHNIDSLLFNITATEKLNTIIDFKKYERINNLYLNKEYADIIRNIADLGIIDKSYVELTDHHKPVLIKKIDGKNLPEYLNRLLNKKSGLNNSFFSYLEVLLNRVFKKKEDEEYFSKVIDILLEDAEIPIKNINEWSEKTLAYSTVYIIKYYLNHQSDNEIKKGWFLFTALLLDIESYEEFKENVGIFKRQSAEAMLIKEKSENFTKNKSKWSQSNKRIKILKEILSDDHTINTIKQFNELVFLNGNYIGWTDFSTGQSDDWDQKDVNNKKLGTLKILLETYQKIINTYYNSYKILDKKEFKKIDDYYKITRKKLLEFIDSIKYSNEIIKELGIYENIIDECSSVFDKKILDGVSFFKTSIPIFIKGWLYDKNLLDNSYAPLQYEKKEEVESFIKIVDEEIKSIDNKVSERKPKKNTEKEKMGLNKNTILKINKFVKFKFSDISFDFSHDNEDEYNERENIKLFYIKKMVLSFEKVLLSFQKKHKTLDKEDFNDLNDYYKLLNNKIISLVQDSVFSSEIISLPVWGTHLLNEIGSLQENLDIFEAIGHSTITEFNKWLYDKNLLENGRENHKILEVDNFLEIIDQEVENIEKKGLKARPKKNKAINKENKTKQKTINIENITIKFHSKDEAYVYIDGVKNKKITKKILKIQEKPWRLLSLLSMQNISNAKTSINREQLKNSLNVASINALETHKSKLNGSLKSFLLEYYNINNREHIIKFNQNTGSYNTLFGLEPIKEYRQSDIFPQSTGNFNPEKFSE